MTIEHVKAGDPLSATQENKKIAAINDITDRLNTLHLPNSKNGGIVCTVKNTTQATIATGGVLAVNGLRKSVEKDKLKTLYKNSGVQINGSAVTATSSLLCFALESIQADGIGKCFIPGVVGAEVTIKADNHQYAKPKANGLESCSFGCFRIIGKSTRPTNISSDSDYDGFAILSLNNLKGHIVGVIQQSIDGGQHSDVTVGSLVIPSVSCPLLRTGESISAGSVVVMSWNELENELQIIEAQCEGESE